MTAPTLLSDTDLRKAIAWRRIPLTDGDPRLPAMYEAGDIWPGDDGMWWLVKRRPSTLTAEQQAYVADDQRHVRAEDM